MYVLLRKEPGKLMSKVFNTNGACRPDLHYMVDIRPKLKEIKAMVDAGEYFIVNRARQYGKTTTLHALADYLKDEYEVVSLDFQMISALAFEDETMFVSAFSEELLDTVQTFPEEISIRLKEFATGTARINSLQMLFKVLKSWCAASPRKLVMIIDEVDTASNNQVFLDFLAQLRAYYLKRPATATFHSVILAGVYDVRNIRRKIRPDEEHKLNSPWNIAAKFRIDMSFSAQEIAGMLREYENDHQTGMDIDMIADLIYTYTSGYPYLVSCLCKNMDEEVCGTADFPDKKSAWTKAGFFEAEKLLVNDSNTLFQSLTGKLQDYPELRSVLYELLFTGKPIPYVPQNQYIETAAMFGFIKNDGGNAVISNRIFETVLYNLFISEEFSTSAMYNTAVQEKNQFIVGGHLDMRRILEKFVETFDYLYGDQNEEFLEDAGRRYFLLFLKPIINGVGSYCIEPQTRNSERMDLVIYYRGEQYILELKIWRGNAYNERGEKQLSGYLDHFHLKKGYMLSFNFNKNKVVGVKDIVVGDKRIVEAVV